MRMVLEIAVHKTCDCARRWGGSRATALLNRWRRATEWGDGPPLGIFVSLCQLLGVARQITHSRGRTNGAHSGRQLPPVYLSAAARSKTLPLAGLQGTEGGVMRLWLTVER